MATPTKSQRARWRAEAQEWIDSGNANFVTDPGEAIVDLAARVVALVELLDPPVVPCTGRKPSDKGELLGCEPNRMARGRCIHCGKWPVQQK